MATDIADLFATPVTHKRSGKSFQRWHWQLNTIHGFSYRGDNEDLMGWASKSAAIRAGRQSMRSYFAVNGPGGRL